MERCNLLFIKCLAAVVLMCGLLSCHAASEPVASESLIRIYVSPMGDDNGTGSSASPFRTVCRAQQSAREAAASATGDVVVELAAGVYCLDETLQLTDADSGRNGNTVVYRSSNGPGKARLLGSVPLKGWQPYRDGIWKISVPNNDVFHTLYEGGKRAHKARFPNYEHLPEFPTARGRYLVSKDGTPVIRKKDKSQDKDETAWLTYAPEVVLPVTSSGPKMKMLLFNRGNCDWMRDVAKVFSIDPAERRIEISHQEDGIGARSRFFLEDDLRLLDAPGEFHLDDKENVLYYKPMGEGHPDMLGITMPRLLRLIEIKGASRNSCAANLRFEGLALEETDDEPKRWWNTRWGLDDGALVWMNNATNVEIWECHLRNSGRNGVMMAGHNVGNRVIGCWIEGMGVNGVTLCNRWQDLKKIPPILDRCEYNQVHNCHIHNIGEIHTYASCINIISSSHNEISHCELHDSVRYAVTVRGNTGSQYGPAASRKDLPPSTGNHMHHLRVCRCTQDGGDVGALHCASLNNPNGGFVNTFEQITLADTAAIPGMNDYRPDGIFLDWPRMSMDQILKNIHIVRSQGSPLRSNLPENGESAKIDNVSWKDGFSTELMDYDNIGLTADFPVEYGGKRAVSVPPPAPVDLTAEAAAWDTVELNWRPPGHTFRDTPWYTVFRNGKKVALVAEPHYTDRHLAEHTEYRYQVVAQDGDFCRISPKTSSCSVQTLQDKTRPVVKDVWSTKGGNVRVRFSKPMEHSSASCVNNYVFDSGCCVKRAMPLSPNCVELTVVGFSADSRLTIRGVTDNTISRNELTGANRLSVAAKGTGAFYIMDVTPDGYLLDDIGSGGDARLYGGAAIEQNGGPFGGPALVLDGIDDYAEASAGLNFSNGDFTIILWMMKIGGENAVLSKGNGFGSPVQWSFGYPRKDTPDSVSLRSNNVFYNTEEKSVPPNKWVHVAFVRRGNQGFTYVNGDPNSGPHDMSAVGELTNNEPLRIGRRTHESSPGYFKGKLAGIKILKQGLSDEEIRIEAGSNKRE